MDLSFVRNQIELKFNEISSLQEIYISGVKAEFENLKTVIDIELEKDLESQFEELEKCRNDISSINQSFNIAVVRLTVSYQELQIKYKKYLDAKRKNLTAEHDGIALSRVLLQWSDMADSAGYDKEKHILDISFKTGGVYRYFDVPYEFYEKLTNRRSFKGFKNELSKFEFKKIE